MITSVWLIGTWMRAHEEYAPTLGCGLLVLVGADGHKGRTLQWIIATVDVLYKDADTRTYVPMLECGLWMHADSWPTQGMAYCKRMINFGWNVGGMWVGCL